MEQTTVIIIIIIILCLSSTSSIAYYISTRKDDKSKDDNYGNDNSGNDNSRKDNSRNDNSRNNDAYYGETDNSRTDASFDDNTTKPKNGDIIICTENSPKGNNAIYKYDDSGSIRWFPNSIIAESWESTLNNPKRVDCTKFSLGKDFLFNSSKLTNGLAVSCANSNDSKVYRYINNSRSLYPDSAIAESWDPSWKEGYDRIIDCNTVTQNINISFNPNVKAEFYEHCDYKGDVSKLGIGDYKMEEMGIRNDGISSVKVPKGLKVTLYDHDNFEGSKLEITSDIPCLNKFNFEDSTSSIKIEKNL